MTLSWPLWNFFSTFHQHFLDHFISWTTNWQINWLQTRLSASDKNKTASFGHEVWKSITFPPKHRITFRYEVWSCLENFLGLKLADSAATFFPFQLNLSSGENEGRIHFSVTLNWWFIQFSMILCGYLPRLRGKVLLTKHRPQHFQSPFDQSNKNRGIGLWKPLVWSHQTARQGKTRGFAAGLTVTSQWKQLFNTSVTHAL